VPAPTEKPNLRAVSSPETAEAKDVRAGRPYIFTGRLISSGLRRSASALVLFLIDVWGIALAVYGALALKEVYRGNFPVQWGILWKAEVVWLPFLALVTALVFSRAGLYGSRETRPGFPRVLSSLAVVVVVTLAFAVATNQPVATGSTFVVGFFLASICVGTLRWSYDSTTREILRAVGARRVAVLYGSGARVESLSRALGRDGPDIRYEFVATVDSPQALKEALVQYEPDEIVADGIHLTEDELVSLLDIAHRRGVKVRVAPTTAEVLTHQAAYVPGRAVPLFELRPPVLSGADWMLKRAFDLLVSGVVVAGGLPLWLLIAGLVKLTSSGPVFYRDARIGVGEGEFRLTKFRTMYDDAGERQTELEALNEADGALFKLRRDPRVTPFGRLLRRFSIDELPNVLNVLRGQMSLVGPRPLPIRDYKQLEPWHRKRYLVLPGITGLWQISGRSDLSFDDLVRLDFYYLENWSIWLDITILIKTIPAVLARRGAY